MLKNISFFIGHRGTRIDYDENTLESFEIALNSGANYIEFDVSKTFDNELVIFHDSKVDRITKSKGFLERITYPEIALEDLRSIAEELTDVGTIEQAPTMEGRTMLMTLAPAKN